MFNPSDHGHRAPEYDADPFGFDLQQHINHQQPHPSHDQHQQQQQHHHHQQDQAQSWSRFGFSDNGYSPAAEFSSQHQDHVSSHSFPASGGMDWDPTPSDMHSDFHSPQTHLSQQHHQHQASYDPATGNADLDTFSPARSEGGVRGLVAQWENKSYVPPVPPRPIQNSHHQQQLQQQTHPSIHHDRQQVSLQHHSAQQHEQPQQQQQSSLSHSSSYHFDASSPAASSHFGSLNMAAHSQPIHSPTEESHFGSFGGQSRVASPDATSPPAMNFGSFQSASRVSSPMGGPSSGQFGSLDNFMAGPRITTPMVASPMVTSPGPSVGGGVPGTPGASGTPGFEIWRPPASMTPKVEPTPTQPTTVTSPSGYFRPPLPTTPKPSMQGGSQFVLDFKQPSARAKAKAPAKPPRPRASISSQGSATLRASLKQEPPTPQPSGSATLATLTDHEQMPPPPHQQQHTPQQESPDDTMSPRTQTGTRPSREQVPAEAWEQFKTIIRSLYLEERKPLKEVMSIMAEKHGFQATPKMYKTRFSQWGFVKNNTEDEVKRLLSMKFQRDAEGKVSEFMRNGKVVNLGTYLKRKGVTEYDLVDFQLPADLPEHIRCRTPTPPLAQGMLSSPDLLRAQELVVGSMRKAFLHCRQFEMDSHAEVGWPSMMVWGALSSELLLEANFFFEMGDADQGGDFLMKAFKQLESDLKQLTPQGIMEVLLGMVNRDLGMITALCKYLAAYSTTNLDRSHPWRLIFTCLYEVQQKHGAATLSELLWSSTPAVAEELEAIYGRQHPYVARTWIDLALFYNHTNHDRLEDLVPELRLIQRQLEQKMGAQSAEALVVRYAITQAHYAAHPHASETAQAAHELWSHMKGMNLVFAMRDTRSNVYCYHSPVKVDPWTKRCRRRYDSADTILEEHVGVKIQPYFEEDFHTTEHAPDSQDAWASAMGHFQGRWGHI